MAKLRINKGLPGSGKSTETRKWAKEDPKNRVIVCRDDLRSMCGPYWIPTREKLITELEDMSVVSALKRGFDVTVDATNLRFNAEARWKQLLSENGVGEVNIEFIDFTHVSVETCIERDLQRGITGGRLVGKDVILNMAKTHLNYDRD